VDEVPVMELPDEVDGIPNVDKYKRLEAMVEEAKQVKREVEERFAAQIQNEVVAILDARGIPLPFQLEQAMTRLKRDLMLPWASAQKTKTTNASADWAIQLRDKKTFSVVKPEEDRDGYRALVDRLVQLEEYSALTIDPKAAYEVRERKCPATGDPLELVSMEVSHTVAVVKAKS